MAATEIAEFGFPGPLRDALVGAILSGEKTATTGLLEAYRRERAEVEAVGGRALVVDSAGRGVAVIETTEVEVKRMGDVDLELARDEGEGFENVEEWRDAHVRFFTSAEMIELLGRPRVVIDDDTLVVAAVSGSSSASGRPMHARRSASPSTRRRRFEQRRLGWSDGGTGSVTARRTRGVDAASTSGTSSAPTRRSGPSPS